MTIIGIFLVIYAFARKVVKNEPLKSQLESIFNSTNNKLSLFKNQKPKLLFNRLLKLSTKGILFSFIFFAIILLLPEKPESYLTKLIVPVAMISMLLNLSISWILYHKKTIKKFFLNFQMLGLLFSPLIVHFVGIYFVNPSIDINEIFASFQPIINEIGIFYFQLIWIAVVGISLYIGAMLIALPIYIILYTLIIITSLLIKFLEKYIDNHILDGIVGIVALIVALIKIFM